ncbi:hypothetical protein GCM10022421_33060 [Oceanisphaera sediminis]|uniref:Uncharacterized protein n=1 Tax=Oceanisphaera sediminis TaxID=981381 RepID=A0ABP7ER71_9GAMM
MARRVGGADPFILSDAKELPVGVVYRHLGAREEATEIDCHDHEMPWTAFPEPSGMSLWRVVGGGCVASELGFKNDQIFIHIGMKPIAHFTNKQTYVEYWNIFKQTNGNKNQK